ncbi:MAG TPA: SigE family RNA polymerase sigma factor [Nocardioides sp.]|uniref:SigE family RNA polymerase sigma factor n=1 Tax=Nocardioides sp. TaxID=35761 RepID=UPI002BFC210F|nr:SigE family RNA polymerase sigma factor [Nocardioides sp.]HTW16028.1 SigE family RNA polymerase sigma factor [Nocardioides sp.]
MRSSEFEAFVDGELARLLGYARVLTGNDHDAWDLVQEGLVRVGLRWGRIERSGNPAAYVRTTLVRLNIDRLRRRGREHPVAVPPDTAMAVRLPEGVDAWLVEALASLTPRQRTAVALRFVDDLDVAGVAAAMGCSGGTAKSHLSRGLQRLRDLAPEGDLHG